MNCPKCNHENEDGAMFCRNCGSPMRVVEKNESNVSSILLLIWVIASCVLYIGRMIFEELFPEWWDYSWGMWVQSMFAIATHINCILPALAIKNKTMKFVGIIVMSIMVIWWCCKDITWVFNN